MKDKEAIAIEVAMILHNHQHQTLLWKDLPLTEIYKEIKFAKNIIRIVISRTESLKKQMEGK